MDRDLGNVLFLSFLLLLAISYPTMGAEIYHWVDEDGVMHFSEWAPNPDVPGVLTITVPSSRPPDYDPNDDQSSISSQAERTNVRWSEIKARRDERREQRLEAAERAARLASLYAYEQEDYFEPPVWYAPVQSIGLGHHHRPKLISHQQNALDRFGPQNGMRPYSINSSAHRARVTASKDAARGLRPRHGMRQPGPSVPRRRSVLREPE